MYSNFGAMAELVAAMVLKLNGLISELSNGYYMVDLQIKLYGEMSKIKSFGDTKIHGRTRMLASKHDLLSVFFTLLDHLKKVTLRKDVSFKCFIVGCSLILVTMLKLRTDIIILRF